MFWSVAYTHRILKRLAKYLIRLRACAGLSEPLLVTHTTFLGIHVSAQMIYNLGVTQATRSTSVAG